MNLIYLKNSNPQDFIAQFVSVLTAKAIYFIENSDKTVCVGLEEDGKAIAAICAHPQEDAMEIVSLYVHEGYRRKKNASELLEALYWETLNTDDVNHISAEYSLLPPETMKAVNATLTANRYHFYEKMQGQEVYECDVRDLVDIKSVNPEVQSFAEMGMGYHEKVLSLLNETMDTQLVKMPETTDMDISQVVIRDGVVVALFWVERYRDDLVRVAALHSSGDSKLVSTVVSASIKKAKEILTPESVVICDLYDGLGKKALTHMTDGKIRASEQFVRAFALL